MKTPFNTALKKKPYSTLAVKNHLFGIALRHSLFDAVQALIPVAVLGAAAAFLLWFWSTGPIDLVHTLFGIKLSNLFWSRVISTFVIGFPTLIFAKASFRNFWLVHNDKRGLQRDQDQAWERIRQLDRDFKDAESDERFQQNMRGTR